MRLCLLLMVIPVFFTTQIAHATLYPVTGDTSTIWNAIDLLPAGKSDSTLAKEPQAGTDTVSRQGPDTARSIVPASQTQTPAIQTPAVQTTSPAAAPKAAIEHTPPVTAPAKAATIQTEPAAVIKETPAKSSVAAEQEQAVVDSVAQPIDTAAAAAAAVAGSLVITSVPDGANIVINDVSVGITPYQASGFYPGLYEITLVKEGYEPFKKAVDLKEKGTEFITVTFQKESGYLYIASVPESASVLLNDTVVGSTPFRSSPLIPGIYNLRIEAPEYSPYTEKVGISPKLTDTLQISLLPLKKARISENGKFKKSQTFRRISFGTIGAVAAAAGLVLNFKTKDQLTKEKEAREAYYEANLRESEYTELYADYRDETKTTDRYALARNICYTIGIIGGVGFAFSIPF